MHRSLVRAAALLIAGAAAGPALAVEPDPLFPQFGNTGYEVDNYDIAIDATDLPDIRATATLDIVAQQTLSAFTLDLRKSLYVLSVTVDGRDAAYAEINDKLSITPRNAIAKNGKASVRIRYAGKPRPLTDPTFKNPVGKLPLGWLTDPSGLPYVVSEPVGASSWYPANDVPADKATFSFAITVPAYLTAVANGLPSGVGTNGTKTVYLYRLDQPMTTWMATVHIDIYQKIQELKYKDIPIYNYITENVDATERQALAKTPEYMKFISNLVGEYPFDSYGNMIVEDPNLYYALENATLSTYPSDFIEESVLVHELAHQWFGDSVTVRHWEDIWIAEGFATYFETLWPYRDDPAAFDEAMRSLYAYLGQNNIGAIIVKKPSGLFGSAVYERGAVMLYALQLKVGNDTFFDIVRSFYANYRDKNASTQDFIDLAVAVSGDGSVRPFLEEWLYKGALPPLGGEMLARASEDARAAIGAAMVRASKSHHQPQSEAMR